MATSISSNGRPTLHVRFGTVSIAALAHRFEGTRIEEKRLKFKANLANQTCLHEISDCFSIALLHQWLDTVIASLDCYTWVFSQGFLNPLLLQGNPSVSTRVKHTSFIIHRQSPAEPSSDVALLLRIESLHEYIGGHCQVLSAVTTPGARVHSNGYHSISNVRRSSCDRTFSRAHPLASAKCTVIVRLLNFITALWSKYPQDTMQAIDSSFYDRDLMRLIVTCVFNPTQLGFDMNNEEINKKLPERVRNSSLSQIETPPVHLDSESTQIDDHSSARFIAATVL